MRRSSWLVVERQVEVEWIGMVLKVVDGGVALIKGGRYRYRETRGARVLVRKKVV
jgi:hypothetical protein